MKAEFEQYFTVVLFIMLNKVALTFESVDQILKCDIQIKSIEQYFLVVLLIAPPPPPPLPPLKSTSMTIEMKDTESVLPYGMAGFIFQYLTI